MIRLILILLTVTALSLGISWIADEPGRVMVEWGDYRVETSLLVVLAAVAGGTLVCVVAYYCLFLLLRSPRMWLRSRLAKRQALGLEALTAAFAAIVTQDIRQARRQIARAQQYLPQQPLTLMLASQAARLEGNETQSRFYLEQMLKTEGTEFMAMRGLIENARRAKEYASAALLAEKALAIKPKDVWATKTLIGLYLSLQRTQDALRLLDIAWRNQTLDKQEHRQMLSGALYEYALPHFKERRFDLAVPALQEALRNNPACAPAAVLLAEAYRAQDDIKPALAVLLSAWKIAPNPALAHAAIACLEPLKTRKKAMVTLEKLAHIHPQSTQSAFLRIAVALKTGRIDAARSEAQYVLDKGETSHACSVMAEVETADGNNAEAARWSLRAQSAPSDSLYRCEDCGQVSDGWRLVCPHCASAGSMASAAHAQ